MSYNCNLAEFYCNVCDEKELGGIRGVAWVRVGTPMPDPTSLQTWKNAVCNGLAYLIPAVTGTSDGGAAVEIAGYGDHVSTLTGMNFAVSYRHPWTLANQTFYNRLMRVYGWELWYATDTKLFRAGKSTFAHAAIPITEDKAGMLEYTVNTKWASKELPFGYDASTVVAQLFKDCDVSQATLACFACEPITLVDCNVLEP